MTVERVNELFQTSSITSAEHSFLLSKLFPIEKQTSNFAWASLTCAGLAWILILSYTINGREFALLSGGTRLIVTSILAPLALVFYYLARKEIRDKGLKGIEIAVRGQALAIVMIVAFVVPGLLMFMFLYVSR